MKRTILTLLALSSLAAGSQGALLVTERFNYPDGAIVSAPNSPWISHSGTGGSLVCSNSQLAVSTQRSEDANTPLPGSPYTTNSAAVLYSKFDITFVQVPTAAGTYFAHFKDLLTGASTGFSDRIWSSATNAVEGGTLPAGTFRLGVGNGSTSTSASGQLNTNLTTNVTYTIVTRYVPSTGIATIWLNPLNESDPSVTASDADGTQNQPNKIDVSSFAFRQATGEGTMYVDNLKVATSFDDLSAPGISFIPDQFIPAGSSTAPIPFTVVDDETPAASLIVTGSSSNTLLLPDANVVFGGSGTNRTVTLTPTAGMEGSSTVTVNCKDADNKTTSITFVLTVGAPSISAIPDVNVPTNTTITPLSFTIGDAEEPVTSLTVSGSSSNPDLIPNANIQFGGSGANRTVTVTPALDQAGTAIITVTVSDGINNAHTSFGVTVYPLLGVLFSDNFDYPDGALYNAPGSPWSHHSPSGMSFFELVVTNGEAILSGGLQEDLNVAIPGQPYYTTNGYLFYAGFTVRFTGLPSSAGEYFAHFRDNPTSGIGFRARVFGTTSGAASGKFRLGLANQGAAFSVTYPQDLSLGTTYAVVTRYNVGTGVSTMWVNGTSDNSASVTATDSINLTEIDSYALRQNTGIGTNYLDNLRIGTSFSDVATIIAVPVPVSLTIAPVGPDIQVSWPTNSTGYMLESTSSLGTPSWNPVVGSPSVAGTNYVLTISSPSGNAFFRLNKMQ